MNVVSLRLSSGLRQIINRPASWVWAYLLLITGVELVIVLLSPVLGMVLYALLLNGLLIHGACGQHEALRSLCLSLALLALLRLQSLVIPVGVFPQLAWYPLIVVPLAIAVASNLRQLPFRPADLGLRPGNLLVQFLLGCSGLGLGALFFLLGVAKPPLLDLVAGPPAALPLALLLFIVATGFIEELIFRGLIQAAALPLLSRQAIIYSALLFAMMHSGHRSLELLGLAFGVGIFFGAIVYWSGSILGVSLAHMLINVTWWLIMPTMAAQSALLAWHSAIALLLGGSGLSLLAIVLLLVRRSRALSSTRASSGRMP